MFVPRYDEQTTREAVASSFSYTEALRKLGLRPVGSNHREFRRYVDVVWEIPTSHFDPARARNRALRPLEAKPLDEVLVPGSTYSRHKLKLRLYEAGLKQRRCEMCGQGETWRGERLALILDHANGVPDDNRFDNLRILCPNCNATLPTHCGRKNQVLPALRECRHCGGEFTPRSSRHKYCSRECGQRHDNRRRGPRTESRRLEWPSYVQLIKDMSEMTMVAVGHKYRVSDNAVRKWVRLYEADIAKRVGEALTAGQPRAIRI
jgi:hypothetical protein